MTVDVQWGAWEVLGYLLATGSLGRSGFQPEAVTLGFSHVFMGVRGLHL